MASCKEGESRSACIARITNEKLKFKPYEGAVFRYKGEQCSRACEDPTSDLCNRCLGNEKFDMNKGKMGKFHGRMGGPIPEHSHIEGSAWNLAQREKNAAKGAKAAPKKRASAKAKTAPKKRVSVKAKAKKSSSSGSSSSGSSSSGSSSSGSSSSSSGSSSSSSSSASPSPVRRVSVKAKRYAVKGKGEISAAAAAIIAAAKLSSHSSSGRSSRRRSSKKVYVPVSRASSGSPGRRAPPNFGRHTPLSSGEKISGNVAVLKRIQEGLNANPNLAPELD